MTEVESPESLAQAGRTFVETQVIAVVIFFVRPAARVRRGLNMSKIL